MRYAITFLATTFGVIVNAFAEEQKLADFIGNFDYDTRIEMKAGAGFVFVSAALERKA
jgi:hypothetical protein